MSICWDDGCTRPCCTGRPPTRTRRSTTRRYERSDLIDQAVATITARSTDQRDTHEAELTDLLAHPQPTVNHDLLGNVREHIRDILDHGQPETTKTLLAALIDHIDNRASIKPTFRVKRPRFCAAPIRVAALG